MKNERCIGTNVDKFGQLLLVFSNVNDFGGVISEHSKILVNVKINRGRLNTLGAKGVDNNSTFFYGVAN